ncbi:hypothetical protein GCM10009122_03290 [Fulvivirga kasyanovii]|uniref:DUF697 domain-containing protein n=1 Tax=Fulvivirga kasyanovii TaxID=396812 RepID=A0ABW9RUD7_9BACT|nr:DUF697 domain-containing protein [Fulvivirga kasyanovii]MTI26869.1 DUF697 domain-containing protein [Fulvivirga kasyanovii]
MKSLKKIGLLVSLAFILGFVLFAVNQIIAFHANLTTINVTLAWLVTGFISVTIFLLLLIPFVLIARLPKSVAFPDNYEDEAQYHTILKSRLARNKLVRKAGFNVNTEEGMKQALELLNKEAQDVIKQTAKSVFFTTAISQNGKLDALTVFITQSRMIWKVAHIYWQRPSLRDMVKLYGNVGATALIASELDEIDITRQIEPIINAVLRSPGRSLPVIGHAAHIVTDSLLEGSTNAFLTLRVGIVTQRYCGSWDIADRKTIRKNSFITASALLKNLVLESSGKVVTSVMTAIKDAGKNTIRSSVKGVTGIFKRNKGSEVTDPSFGKEQ